MEKRVVKFSRDDLVFSGWISNLGGIRRHRLHRRLRGCINHLGCEYIVL